MITVKTPDGGVAHFPDGTDRETIKSAMRKKFAKPQQSGPERFMRRLNDTLTFGFNDELQAGVKTLFGNKSYNENLADERRKLKEARSNSTLADVVPDTAGMLISGAATLPVGIAKAGGQVAAKAITPLSRGAEQAAKATAQAVAPATKAQILKEATRAGGVFGAAQGYGTGEDWDGAFGNVVTGTAGGAALGRLLPSTIYGVKDRIVDPAFRALKKQRANVSYGPAQAAREFDEAGVNPFGPAMAPGTPVAGAAKYISRSAVGKPLQEAAKRTNEGIEQRLRDTMIDAGGGRSQADVGQDVQAFLKQQITGRSVPHAEIASKAKGKSIKGLRDLEDLSQTDAGGLPIPPRVQPVPPKSVRPVEPKYPPASEIVVPRQEPQYPTPRMPKVADIDEANIANRIREPFLRREQELILQEKALRDEFDGLVKSFNDMEMPPGVARTGFSPDELKQLDVIRAKHAIVNGKIAALRKEFDAAKAKAVGEARTAEQARAMNEARKGSEEDRAKAVQDAVNREHDLWQQTYDQKRIEAEDIAARATAARVQNANREADRLTRSDQARSDRQFQQEIDSGNYSRTFGGTRETYPTEFDAGYALAQRRFYPGRDPKMKADLDLYGRGHVVNLMKDGTQTSRMLRQLLDEGRKSRVIRSDDINSDEFKSYLSKRIGREAVDALYGSSRGGGISLDGLRQLRTRVREASDAEAGFRGASDAAVKRLEQAISADYHAKLRTGNDKIAATIARVTDARYAAFTKEIKQPLRKVFGEDVTPEQGLERLFKSAQKVGGNEQLLKSFVRVYRQKGDQRQATVAVLTPMMRDGMESFAKGWDKLSDSAKDIIYAGASRQLRESHQRLVRLYKLMEPYRAKSSGGIDVSQPANWALAAGLMSNVTTGIALAGGAHMTARLMASPKFVNWLTKIPNSTQRATSRREMLRHMAKLKAILNSQVGLGQSAGDAMFEAAIEMVGITGAEALYAGPKARDYGPSIGPAYIDGEGYKTYEIDDSEMSVKKFAKKRLISGLKMRAEDVFYHPELFAQYPELKNVAVRVGKMTVPNALAQYDSVKKEMIFAASTLDRRDFINQAVHEFQHAIDDIEGNMKYRKGLQYHEQPTESRAFAASRRQGMPGFERPYNHKHQYLTSDEHKTMQQKWGESFWSDATEGAYQEFIDLFGPERFARAMDYLSATHKRARAMDERERNAALEDVSIMQNMARMKNGLPPVTGSPLLDPGYRRTAN